MSKSDWLREQREAKSSRGGAKAQRPAQRVTGPRAGASKLGNGADGISVGRRPSQVTTPEGRRLESPREAIKRGRPLYVDKAKTLTAVKPWVAAGLSRRTWYRRRAERAKQ